MRIRDIYKKYSIPPNLVEHMLTVTKVAVAICSNWKGEKLDFDGIKKSALVHDLGNIVRFDFDKHPEFLGDEVKNIESWRSKQSEIVKKYGTDDHEVTRLMLTELGFSDNSIEVISSKSFVTSAQALNSNDWNLKILLYSDMRVSPSGIVDLENRLSEVIARRPDLNQREDIDELCDALRKIEKQIQENLEIALSKLDTETLKIPNEELLETII